MAIIHHKHDVSGKSSYSPTGKSHNWNKTITRGISLAPNFWAGGITPYPGWSGNYSGGYYENISDSYIQPGYLYYSYQKGNGSYITGTKMLAILDVFNLSRYAVLSNGLNFQVNPALGVVDTWVAWSIYDTSNGSFKGNYCSGTASSRLSFNLTPLDSFPDVVSHYNISNAYTWVSKVGVAAPTATYNTAFYTLKSGGTLSPSGSTIRITNGHPTGQYLITGKNLRFHGFLSYGTPFNTTTYAFVTVDSKDYVKHVAANSQYGGSKYPARNTTTITHTVLPMCRLTTGSIGVEPYTPVTGTILFSATPEGFTVGGATPITNLSSLVASPNETKVITDVHNNPVTIPNWMTGDLFTTETAVFLESDGGNVEFFDTGYYGTDTVFAYWNLDIQGWTGYTGYTGGGGGTTYTMYLLSDPIDNGDPNGICGMYDPRRMPYNTPVYIDSSTSFGSSVIYQDSGLSIPFDGQNFWYYVADATGTPLAIPSTIYNIDGGGNVTWAFKCK